MAHIWLISDGKMGHLNQSRGLAEALQRIDPSVSFECLEARPWLQAAAIKGEQAPDLVISAGHATHLCLLLAAWRYSVPSVVLMRPTLPLFLFDLCLIPAHDQPAKRGNVVETLGALNRMQAGIKTEGSGLILLGGPSRHFSWDEAGLFEQIKQRVAQQPLNWVVGDSRRTPAGTLDRLADCLPSSVNFAPCQQLPANWLPEQLAQGEYCWVTEDSVSMVYEALTAGAKVGTLTLGAKKPNRLSKGLQQLMDQGYLINSTTTEAAPALNEAERCAKLIKERFLQ